MDVDKAGLGLDEQRNVRRAGLLAASLLGLAWTPSALAEPRHFDLPAGDAQVMVNEFSRQADLQVLFDYPKLAGMQTHAVVGEFEPPDALTVLLQNLPLHVSWVNDRTLAIKPVGKNLISQGIDRLRKLWHKATARPEHPETPEILEQVLIAARLDTNHDPPPIGASLMRLSRTDIENSGYATTQDFIHTLPQVFGGGPSEDTQLGREAETNVNKGTGINLRGLDASATLVLIDGRRMAPSGGLGLYTDISNIPLSAIDHIDILPDGASAQFGADAIGGVANFVLRSDLVGSETQLRYGGISGGPLSQRQFSQVWGAKWDALRAMVGFEYYDRDAVPAGDRAQATSDLRPFGGTNFNVPYGAPGTLFTESQIWAIPTPKAGVSPTTADFIPGVQNLYDQWLGADILPAQKRWSLFGTLRTDVSHGIDLFADAVVSRRSLEGLEGNVFPMNFVIPATNPFYFNPENGTDPISVLTATSGYLKSPAEVTQLDTGNLAVGATFTSSRSWSFTGFLGYTFEKLYQTTSGFYDPSALDAALADENPETAFNPFGGLSGNNPATLATIERTAAFRYSSNIRMAGLTASGDVFAIPGGAVRLTTGFEYRNQVFDTTQFLFGTNLVQGVVNTPLHRTVVAAFGQIQLPILREDSNVPLVRRLDLSLGSRVEDYSDVGRATIPKIGAVWSPATNLAIRGTWTKAFRPPALPDLVPGSSISTVYQLPDPSSPTGVTTTLLAAGTNPYLNQERARTWTLGAEITSQNAPGISLAITYFDTYYTGRIEDVPIEPTVLEDPQFAWLVNRNVTPAAQGTVCSQTVFRSAGNCSTTPVGAIVDNRLHNLEYLQTRGVDLLGKYHFSNGFGNFETALNGAYLLEYTEQKTPGTPAVDLVNTQNNPLKFRFRGSVSWDRRGWGTSIYANFSSSYRDTVSDPNRNVRSWTTVDAQIRYMSDRNGAGPLSHLEFAISAQNVFNSSPPFLNNPLGVGYDEENADLIGRLVSLDVRKRW
jgi:iron complex outermembrane recepter protein